MYDYALTPSLFVSFQRYPYPAAGFVTALATSCGALPFLPSAPGQLVLPCPDQEAFWIGLVPSPAGQQYRLRVLVSTTSGDRVDALTGGPVNDPEPAFIDDLPAPPRHGVPGIFRGDGSWWAFARDTGETLAPACREIELRCRSAPIPRSAGPGRQYGGPGYPFPPAEPRPGKSPPPVEAGETFSVRVEIVEPEHFHRLGGGRLPPLDESNRYGGWRLP
jgi:hypothetical protein